MDDESVAQFVGVTGATPARAEQYMTLSDGNLEQAIQLWYETGGIDMMESTAATSSSVGPSTLNPPPIPTQTRPQPDVVNLDSDDEAPPAADDVEFLGQRTRGSGAGGGPGQASAVPAHSEEDDEAMARRLQEEMYAGGDFGGQELGSDGVRAPIARTTETLIGPDSYDLTNPSDRAAAVAEQLMRRQGGIGREQAMLSQPRAPRAAGGRGNSSIWDQSEHFRPSVRERPEGDKTTMLAAMFRPPFDLMSHLSWDEARDDGKENERWILVNVQDSSIFDCQLLNRDIWKHEGIRETVREHFIFLQWSKDDPRGSQYMQYYFQNRDADSAYPHIAIVDPRTGEQVKVWSGPPAPKPMDFLMQLHEFLDRYSLSASAKNPVARRKPEGPPAASRIDSMTEEQQLEMAMQASLATGPEAGPSRLASAADPDDLTRSITDLRGTDGGSAADAADPPRQDTPMAEALAVIAQDSNLATPPPESGSAVPPGSAGSGGASGASNPLFTAIPSTAPHAEPPASDAGLTRIQFRHPEGRVVRRFALADPVQRIYEWLKAEPLPGLEGREFALSFMGRNLLADVVEQKSIGDAGLRNGSVNVEVVEGDAE